MQQKIEQPFLVDWKDDNLISFLQSNLNERSSFRQIRTIAKQAIELGMVKEAEDKKGWCLSSLENIQKLQTLSLSMQKCILAAIEVIFLSRRISNLRKLGVFSKQVDRGKNHAWLLDGARLAISIYFPELTVFYIKGQLNQESLATLKESIKNNENTWIVIGYPQGYHLTLMRVVNQNQSIHFQLFDSLGATPDSANRENIIPYFLYFFVENLRVTLDIDKAMVTGFSKGRQKDGTNCFSVVLFDLNTALALIKEKKDNLLSPDKDAPDLSREKNIIIKEFGAISEFHRITQIQDRYPKEFPKWSTRINSDYYELGNPQALVTSANALAKLIHAGKLTFTPAHYQEEGMSEEDEEVNECSIM